MCLEESFCPFYRDALNFRPLKIYAAPHRPAVFSVQPSSLRCVKLGSIFCSINVHSAHLPLIAHRIAEKIRKDSAQITCRRKFLCSILVPVCSRVTVLWPAVVQLYWAMLVQSLSLICSPLCSAHMR